MSISKDDIINTLKEVYDPEIPINIYDLGLIYEINILQENKVHILMSLTSPTCPTGEYIREMVKEQIESLGIEKVEVEITFEPLWTPERVSPEAKEELGFTDSISSSNIGVGSVFGDETSESEKICFNCAVSEEKVPLFSASYKKESVWICAKCISKF